MLIQENNSKTRRRSREGRNPLGRNKGPHFNLRNSSHHIQSDKQITCIAILSCGRGLAQAMCVSPVALHFKQDRANVQEGLCMPVNRSIIVAAVSAPSPSPPARSSPSTPRSRPQLPFPPLVYPQLPFLAPSHARNAHAMHTASPPQLGLLAHCKSAAGSSLSAITKE